MKIKKKLQKVYPVYHSLLIVQDLWQVHYQSLLIILLKEFIELDTNTDTMTENVKHVELNISIATVFWNIQILKMI